MADKGCQLPKKLFPVLLMICALLISPMENVEGSPPVKPNDGWVSHEMLGMIAPYLVYPDLLSQEDFSGAISFVLSVGDSYTFHRPQKKTKEITQAAQTEKIALRLNMRVNYTRNKQSEKITGQVSGMKSYNVYLHPIGIYDTPYRQTEEEKISGVLTDFSDGSIIPYLNWSKGLKLISFQVNQDRPDHIGWDIPAIIDTKSVTVSGEHTEKKQYSMKSGVGLISPSHGVSGSRWSGSVKAANKSQRIPIGWVEAVSSHGNTSGSFTLPVYSYDGLGWVPEGWIREKGDNPNKSPKNINQIIWRGSLTVTWSLGSVVPKTKMTLEPENIGEYEDWIPSPIDDERFGPAKDITFVAKIQAKEEGKPTLPGRIHFWLNDVSHEKGQCTNFPLDGKAESDLRFAAKQDNLIIDPDNPCHAYTKDPCIMARVVVEALDTGAYGQLQATCEEQGLVAEYERGGGHSIAIPMDDNLNKVADAWERAQGIYKYDYSATEDEDNQPAKQRRNGDGYTLYEEYRGFMTLDGFVRTNPLKKDLFLYDPDGVVREWYEPHNPGKLNLHYIDAKMMKFTGVSKDPNNRWVNYNSSKDKWYARQYALYVALWTTTGKTVGETKWEEQDSEDLYYMFDQPLKTIYLVRIAAKGLEKVISGIGNNSVKNDVYTKMLRSVVIHEIGHGLGIHHHIDPDLGEETDSSVMSGVFDCAMRYTSKDEEERPELMKDQNGYCQEGQTWKRAEDGEFKDYPAHDCFGQIDIKSDP